MAQSNTVIIMHQSDQPPRRRVTSVPRRSRHERDDSTPRAISAFDRPYTCAVTVESSRCWLHAVVCRRHVRVARASPVGRRPPHDSGEAALLRLRLRADRVAERVLVLKREYPAVESETITRVRKHGGARGATFASMAGVDVVDGMVVVGVHWLEEPLATRRGRRGATIRAMDRCMTRVVRLTFRHRHSICTATVDTRTTG